MITMRPPSIRHHHQHYYYVAALISISFLVLAHLGGSLGGLQQPQRSANTLTTQAAPGARLMPPPPSPPPPPPPAPAKGLPSLPAGAAGQTGPHPLAEVEARAQPTQPAPPLGANMGPLLTAAMAAKAAVAQNSLAGLAASKGSSATAATASKPQSEPGAPKPTAMSQEESIVRVDYSSISDEILRKRTASLVYFNANFNKCRHCARFFATWRELALDIRWWSRVVRLYTINCSDEDNIDVCRRAGATQFPQVRFYWTMSQSLDQDGQRLRVLGKSVHAMRHMIMDRLLESYLEHNRLLAQRARQQLAAASSASSPLASALMPMLGQLFSGPTMGRIAASASASNSSSTGTGSGGLSALVGLFTGKSPGSSGAGSGGLNLMGIMESVGGMQGIGQLIKSLMALVSWRRSLSLEPLASNWPELEQLQVADSRRLLDMLPLDPVRGVDALLVMETQEFLYTGLELMLDLSPYTNQTYVARVRDERSLLTRNLTRRDDVLAPALIHVTKNKVAQLILTAPKNTNDEDLRRVFVRAFERRHVKYPVRRVWSSASNGSNRPTSSTSSSSSSSSSSSLSSSATRSDSGEDGDILARVNSVYMNDLINTIRASLTDQVLRHPDLTDDQYNALVRYVYALINYFPFNNDEALKFFKRLHAWLQNQVSPIDMAEYKKQFHDFDELLGRRRDWLACKSLSTINALAAGPSRRSGAGLLFENPRQLGKVVSNITRLFRANQHKAHQLKSLINMFTSPTSAPVLLSDLSSHGATAGATNFSSALGWPHATGRLAAGSASRAPATMAPDYGRIVGVSTSTSTQAPAGHTERQAQRDEPGSTIERLIKSLTSGSLGSDSSILKLISSALTGGAGGPGAKAAATGARSKFAREFPCGAWKLAHVMVVNEYIKDSPRKDVKHIVLHSLYQYMLHFYACATCGNRVSDVANEFRLDLDDRLADQADSILLVWKMHNRVNKRLESEPRPGSPPKQQFPSESLCAKCRAPKQPNDLVSTPNWHEKQVLAFLVHHYRPQSIISLDSKNSSSSSSFSSSDSESVSSAGAASAHASAHASSTDGPITLDSLAASHRFNSLTLVPIFSLLVSAHYFALRQTVYEVGGPKQSCQ